MSSRSLFNVRNERNERKTKVAVIGTDHQGNSVATVIEVVASQEVIASCQHHEAVKAIAADSGIMAPYLLFNEDAWTELMSLARMLQPAVMPTGARVAA